MWLRASLASAYARGEAFGRAHAASEAGIALAERNGAIELIRRAAEQEAAAIELERDALRERLDDLERMLTLSRGGVDRPAHCLDADVVRALDAIRRLAPSPAPPEGLLRPCDQPRRLPASSLAAGEVARFWGRDRLALAVCGARHEALARYSRDLGKADGE